MLQAYYTVNKISLIIPAKNESQNLRNVLAELNKFNFIGEKIIVIDDKENGLDAISKEFDCKIIVQSSKGYGSAIIEGFRTAQYKYGCIFNADFSFDPKYLESMIKLTNDFSFVFGNRYHKSAGSDDDTLVTFVGNKIFTILSKTFLKINLDDILFTYVLCDVDKFNKLNLTCKDFRLCVELPFRIKINNYKYCDMPVSERKRLFGVKKVNAFRDGMLILTEIIKSFFQSIKK